MKKKICLLLILIFSYFILLNGNIKVKADSGWDGDYDSGSSWDSGSGWDSGSSWDGDYSGGSGGYFGVIAFIVIVALVCAINIVKASNKAEKQANQNIERIKNTPKIVPVPIEKINKYIPDYNREELKRELYGIYKDIQFAWMNFDYDALKRLTTNEIYNMYKNQLETLKLKNGKNIMENFELLDYEVVGISDSVDKIEIVVGFLVTCNDYVIDINTNNVTRGNKLRKVTYNYRITFVKGKEASNSNYCPNCGALLEDINSNICKYCNSTIISKNHNWIMSKKENKEQF